MHERPLRALGTLSTIYLAMVGVATWIWLGWYGAARSLDVMVICALPAALGAILTFTSTTDQRQYVARILACMMFAPILLLFWSTSTDPVPPASIRPIWPFAVAMSVGHAIFFLAAIFWGGVLLTAVPAARGVAKAALSQLRARLDSLNRVGAPLMVVHGHGGSSIVTYRFPDNEPREHRVTLNFNTMKHEVRVRERVSAAHARPRDADEASMRGPADPYFDPTRPNASRVSGITIQTTMIEPQKLAAVPLQVRGDSVGLPKELAERLDAEGMVTLLCAVVTQSGWRWQPVFLSSDKR